MTPAAAKTAATPRTWPASTWGRSARPTTASSVSPACGPMRAATGRCMWCPTRRRPGCPRADATRGFGPSPGWPRSWSPPRSRPGSRSGRWWPTAFTATAPALSRRWAAQACGPCWRSSPARAPGRRPRPPTPRWRRPAGSAGAGHVRRARGGGSPAASATATPRPGGPRTRRWAAGPAGAAPAGGGHHRPREAAEAFHLVFADRPGAPRQPSRPAGPARRDRAAGRLRNWVEQGYKQVKDELGWADFQVRGDRAVRRHWTLVCCAFSFCWHAGQAEAVVAAAPAPPQAASVPATRVAARGAWERLDPDDWHRAGRRGAVVAQGAAAGAGVAGSVGVAAALLAWMVGQPAAPAVAAGA